MDEWDDDHCEEVTQVDCPCCDGSGEHSSGGEKNNPNEHLWGCATCGTYGWLMARRPSKRSLTRYKRIDNEWQEVGTSEYRD